LHEYIVARADSDDANSDHFVAYTVRAMQLEATAAECEGRASPTVADAFQSAMRLAVTRGYRTLSVRAAKYLPPASAAAAELRASGNRSSFGRPLVVMYPPQHRSGGAPRVVFDIVDGRFEGYDTGSDITLDGVTHDDQCAFVAQSVLDLVVDGAELDWATVAERAARAARAFISQAKAASKFAGLPSSRSTVAEAEWRQDIDDAINMTEHDARGATWLGRALPAELEFSSRPWAFMRLVIVIARSAGYGVYTFVIVGESWRDTPECDKSWTAFQVLFCRHSMPLRPLTPRWRGNAGMTTAHRQEWRWPFSASHPFFVYDFAEKRAWRRKCREEAQTPSRFLRKKGGSRM